MCDVLGEDVLGGVIGHAGVSGRLRTLQLGTVICRGSRTLNGILGSKGGIYIAYTGFHTGFFVKGGKPSDARPPPPAPGNSAYYQCFDTPLEKF